MSNHDVIRITNASFYAYHGVASDEQNLGGKFEVDVDIFTDFSQAIANDTLKRTIDYEAVYALIQKTVTTQKYYLLETLASAIAKSIIQHYSLIERVTVRVRKPHPPVKGVIDYIEVELSEPRT